ncbi:Protein FAR1-RELATED SEQUENCE 7 [Platanthera guangdongensis]|uniref:Protein FAR1-RELATED SEQUENCE n=1 Tax=Platanthera guangdongensis TaxID=2320717 RepID=A0ABR2MS61_9ASPA
MFDIFEDGSEDNKRWFVSYNSETSDSDCSCRGFETRDILCKHILRNYNMRNARGIPHKYLLKRFYLNAKKDIYLPNTPTMVDCDSNLIFRNHLMRLSYDFAH